MEEIVQIILKKLPFLLSRLWKLSTKVTSLIGLSSCSYIRVSSCLFPSPFFVVLVLTIKTHTGRRKGRRRTKTTTTRTKAKKLYYYSSGFLKLLFWPWRTASEASMRAFAAVQYLVTVPFSLLLHIWTGRLRNSVFNWNQRWLSITWHAGDGQVVRFYRWQQWHSEEDEFKWNWVDDWFCRWRHSGHRQAVEHGNGWGLVERPLPASTTVVDDYVEESVRGHSSSHRLLVVSFQSTLSLWSATLCSSGDKDRPKGHSHEDNMSNKMKRFVSIKGVIDNLR